MQKKRLSLVIENMKKSGISDKEIKSSLKTILESVDPSKAREMGDLIRMFNDQTRKFEYLVRSMNRDEITMLRGTPAFERLLDDLRKLNQIINSMR